ncbi:LPS O-antigen chain length determinant protein WzzB [Vibrio algicola]|uniref:LPS chain length-determining protein n=1 Tax=Vibrio algicola TaxID=2662262 RepID=A0A5Q0TAQ7_9VIBR|nr:Wzz/FepE/Etk N-terminal domain-containing protein [Vibrio algicola]
MSISGVHVTQAQSPQPHSSEQAPLPPHYYYQQPQDDEIDLRELFAALWQGKWTIIACTALCTILAIAYALLAQEKWTSTAVIAKPQPSKLSEYQTQVSEYQPIFDVYQQDGTVLVSHKLDDFSQPQTLFDIFMQEFDARSNKKRYLEHSRLFKMALADLKTDKGSELTSDDTAKLYSEWYKKLSSKLVDSKQTKGPYILTAESITAEDSFEFLKGYVDSINKRSQKIALDNLRSAVSAKKNELLQQRNILTDQAENRLQVEKETTQYALDIAKSAGVKTPVQNLGANEVFAIYLGANALAAKITALNQLKNLSIIEPRLQQTAAKLSLLTHLNIDNNVKFEVKQYLEEPEKPINRTAPKRSLIAVLGLLLGGMIGIGVVFIRFSFKKN